VRIIFKCYLKENIFSAADFFYATNNNKKQLATFGIIELSQFIFIKETGFNSCRLDQLQ